jgi:hypothetical protein
MIYTCPMHPEVEQAHSGLPQVRHGAGAENGGGGRGRRLAARAFFGLRLSPIIAGAAMGLSSVSVTGKALRLRTVKL